MQVAEINPKDVLAAVENGSIFIDVREPYEVDEVAYDIPGMVHIPLGELPERMNDFAKDAQLIIGCRSGARSMNACQYMAMQGYANMTNLNGGIMGWIENGCPTK